MVLYPRTHEIFIIGGRRSNNKWSPDMYSFVQTPLSTQRLAFDPSIANAASAPRVCIDEELGEIYVYVVQVLPCALGVANRISPCCIVLFGKTSATGHGQLAQSLQHSRRITLTRSAGCALSHGLGRLRQAPTATYGRA